jgi:hypothetical protein
MSIAVRLVGGFTIGFELWSAPGVYFNLYLGFIELAFYNEEELED